MNEALDNKINLVKGKVSQAGYEEAICTFIKADQNRKDSFSDKPLYVLDDKNISDNMYVVTPSVTEALNRVPRKSIGIMSTNGELLIQPINSDVIKVTDKYIAIKTSSSMEEMETVKSDPTKVQENAEVSQKIKNKVLDVNQNARFVCDDYYGKFDLYELKENSLNRVCDNVSYIAVDGDVVYAQTTNIDEDVQILNKEISEPNVSMPVGVLAEVTDKQLDNLEVSEMPEVKEGAPDLVADEVKGENFDISEIQNELSGINNDIEPPTFDFNIEEPTISKINSEDEKTEVTLEKEEKENVFKQPVEKPKAHKEEINVKPEGDINELVSAVREKFTQNKEELIELQDKVTEKDSKIKNMTDELEEKSKKIEELEKALKEKESNIKNMQENIDDMKVELDEKDSKIESLNKKAEKYQETMGNIYSEFSKMLDDSTEKRYFKVS